MVLAALLLDLKGQVTNSLQSFEPHISLVQSLLQECDFQMDKLTNIEI